MQAPATDHLGHRQEVKLAESDVCMGDFCLVPLEDEVVIMMSGTGHSRFLRGIIHCTSRTGCEALSGARLHPGYVLWMLELVMEDVGYHVMRQEIGVHLPRAGS